MNEVHKVQASILYQLRHGQSARYTELMKQTGLESDVFKFHIKALTKRGVIEKLTSGSYRLTTSGKEYANNLNELGSRQLKQPKMSVMIAITRQNAAGEVEYLVQQRKRQPFYDYWGCMSGPAQWGQDFVETAKAEVAKQCGVQAADFTVRMFYRQTDYLDTQKKLLEDKLFVVVTATYTGGELRAWAGGQAAWMTELELTSQESYFENSAKIITLLSGGKYPFYSSDITTYSAANY